MTGSVSELAPVGVSVYKRLGHFRRTIAALGANTLARETELYVFSDAPSPGDEVEVAQVRDFARTIKGFKRVSLIERQENSRVRNNRGGLKQLLDDYGSAIFLEEDIVTAPGFLQFMNSALDFYRDDARVLSISGYCPPIETSDTAVADVFLLRRFSAWGYATWQGRFDPFGLGIDSSRARRKLANPINALRFTEYGEDMLRLLILEARDQLDALDIKIMYHQFLSNTYTVYPKTSLVQNIGHDGSGLHCDESEKFEVRLWDKLGEYTFTEFPVVDKVIKRQNYDFRRYDGEGRRRLFFKYLRFLISG